ncbi:rhs repeat-associated core domain-containing protein [Gigaspora margarita]|uniref:Rhs repeat-associated core domain-containing protein n=1 Tax=Gigaspora margarita TaxID=4874 RepID=A0A8H3WX87_GIGMA|nr:rhs repeat-associated core domain-containing protein [Gigaspora margarita]
MPFYKIFIKKQTFIIPKLIQTEEFETKEWFYEEFGWENSDSTSFDKVDEQNNEDSTLEQFTESLVYEEVKTSTPNSECKKHSNDSQQIAIEEDNLINKFFLNILLFFIIIIIPYFFIRIFFFIILFYNFQEMNIRLRLSTDDFVYDLDPLKINFTQTTISSWFKGYDRYNIEETTEDLVSGKLNPKNLPIIRVCIINREFFLAYNRRLYCLKKAVKNGAKFNKVLVKIVRETDEKAGFK